MGEAPFKDDIRPEPLDKALSERYLAYALSTITARALPCLLYTSDAADE